MSNPTTYKPYQVLALPVRNSFEEKRSEFITYLFPVTERSEAMAELEILRSRYADASHVCWAYVLGSANQPISQAFSDDGEPSGTAGKPILNVLIHREAGNTLAAVVRYFGGIRLGAGGLVRAYSTAASKALDVAEFELITPSIAVVINTEFAIEDRVRHWLAQRSLKVQAVEYLQQVQLQLAVPVAEIDILAAEIMELSQGRANLLRKSAVTDNE